jgi:putative ABC transport system ATP-binding protein
MIEASGLTKVFTMEEMETHALEDVSMSVRAGEFVAVMGPSGCGKSTLLNVLGLLDTPSAGRLRFRGEEVTGWSERRRARARAGAIGFVFQSFNLIDELTVFENVELPLVYRRVPAAARRRRVEELLERMSLSHRRKHLPQQLSGGQQQRVAVARAVAADPALILADEPTGNLDSAHGAEVMELLAGLHRGGATLVMVTHSEEQARRADRILRLHDGRLLGGDREDPRA